MHSSKILNILFFVRRFQFMLTISTTKEKRIVLRSLQSKCFYLMSVLSFLPDMIDIYGFVQVLCLPLCIYVMPSSFSQRLWLMLLMKFCGEIYSLTLHFGKESLKYQRNQGVLVDYTMSSFPFPEEVLPVGSRGQNRAFPNSQHPC